MLVLSRKNRESVMVGGGGFRRPLKVTVLAISGDRVKLGFEADADVPVYRLEIWERMCATSDIAITVVDPATATADVPPMRSD
jgi:carbon storage regulator CsrA